MPKSFQWDLRETAQDWLDSTLRQVIRDIFALRHQAEKTMSRQEVMMLDQELAGFLESDKLQSLVEESLDSQMAQIKVMQDVYEYYQKGGQMQDLTMPAQQAKEGQANMNTRLQQLAFNMSQENRMQLLQEMRHEQEVDYEHLDDE